MRQHHIKHQKGSRIIQLFVKVCCPVVVLTLAACNLFIEDELEWKENIPVHTGYGYDEPVTEDGEFYKLTYQLNSNVTILSDEALNYLRNVLMSNSTWIGVLDFDLNMPKELRPVRGEVLLHGICDKIPEGMIHQVIAATEMEGFYKVLICVMPFDDLFKYIDMDVNLGKGLNLQGLSDPEDEQEDQDANTTSFDDMDNNQVISSVNRLRRVDAEASELDHFHKKIDMPISFFKDKDLVNQSNTKVTGKITVTPKKEDNNDNTFDITMDGSVRVFKTEKGTVIPFGIYLKNDFTYQANLDVEASVNLVTSIYKNPDILPETAAVEIMIAGVPIKLKFCLGVDIYFDSTTSLKGTVKFKFPLHTEFGRDIWDLNPILWGLKAGDDLLKWKLKKEEGYFAISPTLGNKSKFQIALSPGVGLFTDKLSTRVNIKAPYIEFNINAPCVYVGSLGYGFDIRNHEGVKFDCSIKAALQVWIPTHISTVLNEMVDAMANYQKIIGLASSWIILQGSNAETANDYMKSVNELNTLILNLKGDTTYAGYKIYGTKDCKVASFNWQSPWLPTLEESKSPFMYRKLYEKAGIRNEDILHIEYTIDSIGIMPNLFDYTPCLMIADRNLNFKTMVFNDKYVINRKLKLPKNGLKLEYDIPMVGLPDQADLYAFPGYYEGKEKESYFSNGIPLSSKLDFSFDKQQLVNTKTPPDTKVKWIYNYDNQSMGSGPGSYKHARYFRVRWVVDDAISGRAMETGFNFPGTSKQKLSEYGFIKLPVYNKQSEYEAEVFMYCESESDIWFEVFPWASRNDGSENGEKKEGTGTFLGNIPYGCSVIRQNDGSFITKEGPPN